jgi:hypothetical protein
MKTIPQLLELIVDKDLKAKCLKLYSDNEAKLKELPASTKYHHSYVGGLMDHFQQIVYYGARIFKFMDKTANLDCTLDDVLLLCFIHDWDKLERYVQTGVVKTGDNAGRPKFEYALDWTIDPYAKVCTMLAKEGIYLTDEQIHALAFQSGGWSEFAKMGGEMSHLATILHCADMLSSKITPVKENLKVDVKEEKE